MALSGCVAILSCLTPIRGEELSSSRSAAPLVLNFATPVDSLPEDEYGFTDVNNLQHLLETKGGLNSAVAYDFSWWIVVASHLEGVPVRLLASLISVESSFRVNVRSHAGAEGPAQVIKFFWSDRCHWGLNTPEGNIRCGASVLRHYKDRCGGWDCALAMYNLGPARLSRGGKEIAAAERYKRRISRANTRLFGLPINVNERVVF